VTAGRRSLLHLEVPFGAFAACLIALALVFAAVGIPRWLPPALIVRAGIPSPLTGMTRSFVALASGDLAASFAFHPLGPLVFAACALTPMVALASWLRGERLTVLRRMANATVLWSVVGLLVAAWAWQIARTG
jgi:hypothetical protein